MRMFPRAFAAAVGLVVAASAISPATAQQVPPGASTPPSPIRTAALTLVTGDLVQLTTYSDGRQAATIVPGRSGQQGTFTTAERDGHLYLYPDAAMRL